jgi:hypothetical protein
MSVTAIETALVDRLTQRLKTEANLVELVYGHSDYAAVPEDNMVTPSLAVIYNGYAPGSSADLSHTIQTIQLNWLVVINVSSAFQADLGTGVRGAVSTLFDETMKAMLGFRPVKNFKPMKLEQAPGAALSPVFAYYPLAFSTTATYRGTP